METALTEKSINFDKKICLFFQFWSFSFGPCSFHIDLHVRLTFFFGILLQMWLLFNTQSKFGNSLFEAAAELHLHLYKSLRILLEYMLQNKFLPHFYGQIWLSIMKKHEPSQGKNNSLTSLQQSERFSNIFIIPVYCQESFEMPNCVNTQNYGKWRVLIYYSAAEKIGF
jgi:hypothetical protein